MQWDINICNLEQIISSGTENSLYECDHWRDYNGWNYGWNYECTPG